MNRRTKLDRAWVLVKPETLHFRSEALTKVLEENGFIIEEKLTCSRFLDLSDELYCKASTFSPMHKALNLYFFGDCSNYCEVWLLGCKEKDDKISLFAKLGQIKRNFRTNQYIDGLKINVEYDGVESAFGFGFFHVPDPNDTDIETESKIIEKYLT